MTRRYNDFHDDPLYDPEDEIYGDFEELGLDGFHLVDGDDEEDDEDDCYT